jgi:hypothetical protein
LVTWTWLRYRRGKMMKDSGENRPRNIGRSTIELLLASVSDSSPRQRQVAHGPRNIRQS